MKRIEGPLELAQLFRNRKPTLEQVIHFIEQLHRARQGGTLKIKIGTLNCIARLLFTATKQWLEVVNNFKYEICYDPLHTTARRTQKRKSTTAKKRSNQQVQAGNKEVTIDQILADAVQMSRSISNTPSLMTPRRQPVMPENNLTNLPPLQPESISNHSLEESAFMNKSLHLAEMTEAEEKMVTYHKLLGGGRQDLSITRLPSMNTTRQKRTSTKKKPISVRDDDIYLDQGLKKQYTIQKIATKVKMVRQCKANNYDNLEFRLKQINPILTRVQQIKVKLKEKFKKREQMVHQEQQLYSENYNKSFLQQKSLEQKFMINESNNPVVTNILQQKLTFILEGELMKKPNVGFSQFCSKRKIAREIKGELFYQLLHLNFSLDQQYPEGFGDIFIHPK